MTRQNYHYTKMIEELSEVIKEICKAQRFGLHDTNPETGITNHEAIQEELLDALYIAERLGYSCKLDSKEFTKRHKKYQKWLKYSKEQGLVDAT